MTFEAGIEVKRISGKPLVLHFHSTEFDRSGVNINKDIFAIEQNGIDKADCVVTVSNRTRDIITNNYRTDNKTIITVHNAVSQIHEDCKRTFKLNNECKTVTFLGRITSQKGPEYFIQAAKLVLETNKNVNFIMAGKGNLRDQMIKLTTELANDEKFTFPGFIEDKDITELFLKSDIFIMPSVSEPFGIVALEAMQTGLPVIISKQSGVSEITKNLKKVDYWNTQELAKTIIDLLKNPEKSRKMGESGKNEVAKITWRKPANQLFEIYKKLNVNVT